jgi:hypothetical protein
MAITLSNLKSLEAEHVIAASQSVWFTANTSDGNVFIVPKVPFVPRVPSVPLKKEN